MKTIKRIMSVLLVLTMTMCLAMTAFAATPLTNGTLTVTGAQLKGKEVTALRMFTANVDDKNSNGLIDEADLVSYEMEPAWQEFFNQQLSKGHGEVATSAEAYEYVAAMKGNDAKLVEFAKTAKTYYNANSTDFASLTQKQTGDSTNTATFTNLTTGYYLVLPANGSTNANRATDAMIVNVPGAKAAKLELKTEYPSVDKVIVEESGNASGASAQIGDVVKFELTAKVPNMEDFNKYYLALKDTLSAGLTLNADSIKVSVIGKDTQSVTSLTKDTDYKQNVPGLNGESFAVVFDDLKTLAAGKGFKAGDTIKVEYTATLNENAQTGATNPNTNKAELEYSNDPSTGGTGTSEPSVTKTYTFDINVHKYANGDMGTILPGAVFELRDAKDQAIQLVKEANDYTYHVATPAEIADGGVTKVTQFTTVEAGDIVIKGLKEGTYKLHEVTAPTGYNKLTEDVTIVITAEYELDGTLKADSPKYTVNGGKPTQENTINVQNKNGAFLPETGSIGTIGLTIAGAALVIGGIGFTSRKKKEQE